jgi:hypothetical protein
VRTYCLTNWWDGLLISLAECSVVSGHLPLLSLDEFTIAVSHYINKNAWFPLSPWFTGRNCWFYSLCRPCRLTGSQ